VFTRVTPRAIIAAPDASPMSMVTKPARSASRMSAGRSGLPPSAATAKVTSTAMRIPPPTASVIDTDRFSGVCMLKCEGTRRHACTVIPPTSTTQSAANTPSSSARRRAPTRRYEVTQATVTRVSPKDSPKVAGFRQDTGPAHAPPRTANTPRWNNPARNRPAPIRQQTRSTVRAVAQPDASAPSRFRGRSFRVLRAVAVGIGSLLGWRDSTSLPPGRRRCVRPRAAIVLPPRE
jgi:hypothetical protein